MRVGYVVKRYPRLSETFIVSEILAHEEAGLDLEIFALRPPVDTHFQDMISRVRSPVYYLPDPTKPSELWRALSLGAAGIPELFGRLGAGRGESARTVHQAAVLARAVRERDITHLHAHFASSATSVARLAARLADVSYTFTAHAKDIFHESVRPADLSRKLKQAAGVVTVSDYNLRYLQETFGPAAATVRRIYNGLDLTESRYSDPSTRPPRIVAVGRLVEKKGFDVLIEACDLLREHREGLRCEIIGGGELEPELRGAVERRGLQDHVSFLGSRPRREVMERIAGAAVLAAPCVEGSDGNRDGLPTVLLEAMALGTPCVATPVTGIPEAIRSGHTGLLVPQRDPRALADALARLMDDGGLRRALAIAARRRMESAFDIRKNAAELRSLFVSAVRADRAVAPAIGAA